MDYSGGIPALPRISCLLSLPPWITELCSSHSFTEVEEATGSDHHPTGSSTAGQLSMAAAAVAPQSNGVGPPTDPAEREAWEIAQYEKIVDIRDQVFAGTHPRLKLLFPVDPETGEALPTVRSQPSTNPHNSGSITQSLQASQSLPPSAEQSRLPIPPPLPSAQSRTPSNVPTAAAGVSGIDPIFLTKSDVLLRAETQQKRQRIERLLADQVKEKQASLKQRPYDQDDLPDFNVTEVLRKAQELVKPVKFADLSGANGNASASDSFDENTFYSSQMNDSTPETTDKPEPPPKPTLSQNCNYFLRGEKCPYGEKCAYAHNPAARPAPPVQKSQVQMSDNHADSQGPSGARAVAPQGSSDRNPTVESLSQAERISQLEAQLRELKSQGPDKAAGPSQINTLKAQEAQEEEPVYSPPDAVPPKITEILSGKRRDAGQQQQRSSVQTRTAPREYSRYDNVAQSPSIGEGRVVRNHITSPLAPQPARVSPLAVAKAPPISQGKRPQRQINENFREPAHGTTPVQTSQAQRQALNPKKRKKARESGEMVRNVIPRREPHSPEIRIKEEPMSPQPFVQPAERWEARPQPEAREPIYVDEVSPRYREQGSVVYRSNVIDRPAPRYVLDEYREPPPPRYEPDLRRVVSTRQMRPPMIDTERYPSPQPPARAASQVYIPRQEQEIPRQYRPSVQPEAVSYLDHDQDISPRTREVPSMMAPPPRRIVVDQYGNQFYEQEVAPIPRPRQSSMVPFTHHGPPDRSFHSPAPRHSVARIPQPAVGETRYIRQRPSPPPQYVEYVSPTRTRPPLNRDVDSFYGSEVQPRRGDEVRIVDYPPQNANGRYEEVRSMEGVTRGASVHPVGHHYENGSERVARVQSVRPETRRVISYGGEMIPQGTRHVSIRPDEAYARPMDYSQPRVQYYPGPDGRA
ncbi:MAG: hypothetical protein Q9216_003411 [Gyalolechia sp. 2 TL-2023]